MNENVRETVRQVLSNYLEQNHYRKTPERFAVLDVIYSFSSHFSLNNLNEKIENDYFPICKATLYNTLKLLMELHLVISYRVNGETRYEPSYAVRNHCRQVCTVCGKETEIKLPKVANIVEETHLKRFRKEGYSLYIYGICSTCQAKITRKKKKTKNK